MHLVLIGYFNTALVPLGADLYSYSISDIQQTVGASSGTGLPVIIAFVFLTGIFISCIKYLPVKVKIGPKWSLFFPILSLFQYITPFNSFTINFPTEYENNLTINKPAFFLSASSDYFFHSNAEVDIYADGYIGDFEGFTTQGIKFEYPYETQYPFYHSNQSPDVLSPYFQALKTQPNLVIILVEGLGRAFSNEGAYLGNFTPFIDSLADKSLYWKNMLSAGGRTFAVLPALLSSLPFGENGILEMGPAIPKHLSLYTILKRNGYRTSFYYGGETEFDGMKTYLVNNHVDEIIEEKSFPTGYIKLPPSTNNFTWGYSDDELFRYYLKKRNGALSKKPELNVILTVSTHNPFLIPNQGKYIQMVKNRMGKLGFNANKQAEYSNFMNQYSSIMYTDESLKKFFQEYQKRPDYTNTIFVITGDHRLPEIPISTKIDRYHVPLLIYSPMLKRTAQFASISTHFDITPSLLAMLQNQLNFNLPKTGASWMGDGLDTARNFRNIHQYPLMQNKSTLIDFILEDYHINGNTLFKITDNMEETAIKDEVKLSQLQAAFSIFKKKNAKLILGFKMVPDSLISRYGIN
ncbi:LTA synthase family protein [Aquirufa beregesia]|nr:LTA synthase family protein [Aquirufa beregesia]